MSMQDQPIKEHFELPESEVTPSPEEASATQQPVPAPVNRLWWMVRSVSQPLLFFAAGSALLVMLGVAQKSGWISAGGSGHGPATAAAAADVDYICPMMCTPPQKEPGRCPVCAMELVPASTGGGGDERSVVVDPASRRVANIQTVSVRSIPMMRTIKAIGELQYDEGTLKTISAYSDGRFDQLYVDFTGAEVKEGEKLASFYSPELYSAQVEYLQAGKSLRIQSVKSLASVAKANQRLLVNSRQRLIELGMSESQIAKIDRTQVAQSRMDIIAPMSGTVIEKKVVEGEYVKEGQPVFRLADLTKVWLVLELFPEDLSCVCCGQEVEATIKSHPGRTFTGHIAFIDPDVDSKSRTVGVRVVIDNPDGMLRIGDYAKALITVPMGGADGPGSRNFIAEGAHAADSQLFPGLLPPAEIPLVTVIPRNAVLMAANHSVVYVETEPGRFEIRRIETGAVSGDQIVVVKGLSEGEVVATGGNFLLDSQMQLAGNPSLIDPTRATAPMKMILGFDAEMIAAIHQLPADIQTVALEQVICPVTDAKLGSMGVPIKVMIHGKPIFMCCEGCRESLLEDPETNIQKIRDYQENGESTNADESDIPLPPIGKIESSFPRIGEMRSLTPEILELDATPTKSAESESESGRIQR